MRPTTNGPASPDGRVITRNGYSYRLDTAERSRSAQAAEGGSDRLATDDGGHYIARRFNGPRDDFNPFAQDAKFNRGGYRALEDLWAKDVRAGKQVWVKIVPEYDGQSKRPAAIRVLPVTNGHSNVSRFPNASKGKANGKIARLLNEIGNSLAQDTNYPLDGTFLYTETESMMTSVSIFKDLGDHLVYRWPTGDIEELVLELWEATPADNKWAAMEYRIAGGSFDASFIYPGEFDPEQDSLERRDRILQRRYGNKRIVYPSLDES